MQLRLTKTWLEFTPDRVARVSGQLGVYQLATDDGSVLYIGYAGGRSLFGLRSELEKHLGTSGATRFRYEVNMQYLTRYKELLMLHQADTGALPAFNQSEAPLRIGRIG